MRAIYYHSIVEKRDPDKYHTHGAIEIDVFREQANELARNWHVLSLAEISETIRDRRHPFPSRAVHISFDDGYQNNLYASEILDRLKLPWTLFVVTDAVLDGYEPWYVRLSHAIAATNTRVYWGKTVYNLRSNDDKWRLAQEVKARVLSVPAREHIECLDDILSQCGLESSVRKDWLFLSVRDLQQLRLSGVEIGNHSARHPNLSKCSSGELDYEVNVSKMRLQEAIGQPVRFFSYPDGRCNDLVIARVSETHDLAMATENSRHPMTPFELSRYAVGSRPVDLLEVLAPDYPSKWQAKNLRWTAKRQVKRVIKWFGQFPSHSGWED